MLLDLGSDRPAPSLVHHLMTQVVVPRPIAWVVSDNGEELSPDVRWNLAPYSFFNVVASDPPTVVFSVGVSPRDAAAGGPVKDTLTNVRGRPQHTIALPHAGQRDVVEATAAAVEPGRSELTMAGLEPVAWDWPVPMPSGVRVALGCTLDTVLPVADGPQRLVVSRIERVWVDDQAVGTDAKGRTTIDAGVIDPLVRLGAGLYASLGPLTRPDPSVDRDLHRGPPQAGR